MDFGSFGPLAIFAGAATFAVAVFVCVVLTGLLSGLIGYGVLDLGFRRIVQEAALKRYFTYFSTPFIKDFFHGRYGPTSMENDRFQRAVRILDRGESVAPLLGLSSRTLFSLHYRQICGQMQVVATAEAAEPVSAVTPLTDLLLILQRYPTGDRSSLPEPPTSRQSDRQRDLQAALNEIDRIQAELGFAISRYSFLAILAVLVGIYVVVLVALALYTTRVNGPGFWDLVAATPSYAASVFVAVIVALMMGPAASVVGSLVIGWLDRMLASR